MQALAARARAFAALEGAIMTSGLLALPAQTQLLLSIRAAPHPPTPSHARFITRASRDLIVALPWVPIIALIPGAVLLFSAAASFAPKLLPSTFQIARNTLTGGAPPPASLPLARAVAAAAAAAPPSRRAAADASSAPLVAALPAPEALHLAAACGLPSPAALAPLGEALQLGDAVLEGEAALRTGLFGGAVDAEELRVALRARLLPVGGEGAEEASPMGLEDQRAALQEYLRLRRVLSPIALLQVLLVAQPVRSPTADSAKRS